MRGASRAAFDEAREMLVAAVADASTASALGEDLFAVTSLIDREPALRRALTDATSDRGARTGLVRGLFGGRVSRAALDMMAGMASARWSVPRDFPDAAEQLAVLATAAWAEHEGGLDDLEDELFRFGRITAAEPELYAALSSPRLPADAKSGLLDRLLSGKVSPAALRLITRAVLYPRGRSLEAGLAEYARLAAAWRERLIAVVRVAADLTSAQRERLVAALKAMYGHGVQLNVVLDPAVVGGMSIQIGDEFIDGTLRSHLTALRRKLAA